AAQRLHAGEVPLWNPDNMLGAPFLGNMQSAVLYPLNWPYFVWPGSLTLALRAGLKLLVAALGTYVLARQVLRVGPLAAGLAAITFTFGAFLTVWLLHPHTAAAIWLPWLWWATARLVARPGPRPCALLAGLVALTLLSGHPEMAYHLALVTGLFTLCLLWLAGPLRLGRAGGILALWGAGYLLGAGLAAVQLIPFAEYAGLSMSLLRRTERQMTTFWLPIQYAWTAVSPDLFGNPARHTVWGPGINYNESNNYAGVLPLLLAPFALLVRDPRRRLVLCLLALAILLAGVIYGWPLIYPAALAVPGMRFALNQRLTVVLELVLGLLAALGVEALVARLPQERGRLLAGLALAGLGLLGLGVGVPAIFAGGFFGVPGDSPLAQAVWQAGLVRATVLILANGLLLAAIVALWPWRVRLARVGLGALPLVLLADLWQAHLDYVPTVAPAAYFPATAATRFLRGPAPPFRIIAGGDLLAPNTNLHYGLADLRGNDALEPVSYHQLVFHADPAIPSSPTGGALPGIVPSRIWNLLNVRYLLAAPGDDPNYVLDVRQEASSGQTVGEIRGPAQPGQTFVAGQDNLARIVVLGATYGGQARGPLIFHLKRDPAAATDLVTRRLDAARLPDNAYWTISFPPIRQARGQSFYFYFDAPAASPGQGATLWYNAAGGYSAGSRTAGGVRVAGDLVFRAQSLLAPDDPGFRRVLDGGPAAVSVFENRKVLPRAWLTHQMALAADGPTQVERLYDPGFDWRRTALLADSLPAGAGLPAAPPPASADAVTITRYAPELVEVSTRSPAPGVLILADQLFPGWQAQVDGRPAPILPADVALRGVYLPAGAHQVRFVYAPAAVGWGAGISAAAGLILAALLIAGRIRFTGRRFSGIVKATPTAATKS
ncbi:MAG TPA: hypothetical protein VKY74_25285, partial [Chloroflexia bacterium]|nr:hypothetical protein [Chloroflexia bacterium]